MSDVLVPSDPHDLLAVPVVDDAELARVAFEDGLSMHQFEGTGELVDRVADELASGRIVGWMQGGSEFGPRALGNRSILAAPGPVEMRDQDRTDRAKFLTAG